MKIEFDLAIDTCELCKKDFEIYRSHLKNNTVDKIQGIVITPWFNEKKEFVNLCFGIVEKKEGIKDVETIRGGRR